MAPLRLQIDGHRFRDANGREVILRGINCAADAKFPASPDLPSHQSERFFDGDNVSFVDRPFSATDAPTHFARLRRWGYNTIRYVFTWEAIEHAGPGKYDEEWIDHTITLLRIAKDYGFYIFMDPHQDVWSRFSGGSGAPLWTLYACGLDPKTFNANEAAIVQNTYPEPENFPKMIWTTNYQRLACLTIYAMFFAGKEFTPNAIIDGKNIQDYLQDHFLSACKHLAQRIHEAGDLENEVIIGWESFNEPNRGIIGWEDLTGFPKELKMHKGTAPTAWQAILLGAGRACEVDVYDFGGMGPYKAGTELVDPEGQQAWLSADYDDTFYGFKRDPSWKLGECIWAQQGVWDPKTDTLTNKNYFEKDPRTGQSIDYEYFANHWFMDFYRKYRDAIRDVHPEAILFCQPPVLEIPPTLGPKDEDPNMVFAPHFYDGITLIMKKWNRLWNIDVFGILRGKYLTPAFAIKVGESAIRNCFRDQLAAIRKEGMEKMGLRPCIFTEIGIPYDMDDKHAYKTGDYSSQTAAMDANHYALEGSQANGYTLWTYVATNNHEWGDRWNGEDLSIFSEDDVPLPAVPPSAAQSLSSLDRSSPSYSRSLASEAQNVDPSTLKRSLTKDTMTSSTSKTAPTEDKAGYRAAEAFVRPSPTAVHGDVLAFGFDLRNATFTLKLRALSPTSEDLPTEIFLPEWHFPRDASVIDVSGGKAELFAEGEVQVLKWWHAEGEQNISIKGIKRKMAVYNGDLSEEEGYLEQCQKSTCLLM
ncbi:glycoside hydrolase [Trichodelitschia bisporula]|uniref:Glycoside hydrolase n=1 Tax=Trichodelitschia bisporula TaxID=703511 RepID=A0A6G1HVU0_9PEZI|nr:glycoside hydrolase [Trichodelitschia bisporula]